LRRPIGWRTASTITDFAHFSAGLNNESECLCQATRVAWPNSDFFGLLTAHRLLFNFATPQRLPQTESSKTCTLSCSGRSSSKEIVHRAGIKPEQIEDVVFGCVTQAGEQSLNTDAMRG